MGAAVPAAYFSHTEAARKVSAHYESGGRSGPQPPTKAIADPSIWAFSAGGLRDGGLRVPLFGSGLARGIFLAHGGRTQSLAPIRVRRTKLAQAPHKGYSPPLNFGIFRRGWCDGRLGGLVFGCGYTRGLFFVHGGRKQSLAAFRVQRTKLAPTPHQGYSPPFIFGIFHWGVVGRWTSGTHFWPRLCLGHPAGTRRPLAKSRPIPSPADEVGPNPPPRL